MFEKFIKIGVLNFFGKNPFFFTSQFGFKNELPTNDAKKYV